MHSDIGRSKQAEDKLEKRKIIIEKCEKFKRIEYSYNELCDIETIIDNIDTFIILKNQIQRMD